MQQCYGIFDAHDLSAPSYPMKACLLWSFSALLCHQKLLRIVSLQEEMNAVLHQKLGTPSLPYQAVPMSTAICKQVNSYGLKQQKVFLFGIARAQCIDVMSPEKCC